jgi:hypothetical protein
MGRDEGREAGDEGENGRARLLPSRNDGWQNNSFSGWQRSCTAENFRCSITVPHTSHYALKFRLFGATLLLALFGCESEAKNDGERSVSARVAGDCRS